jgi:spermidine synthase
METVHELSDPNAPLTYRGSLVAKHESQKQKWILIDTVEHDEMLFIDGQHQSSLTDEHYYHESFVHTLMTGVQNPKRVLLLGGAEGCLAREVLRYGMVELVHQVDWDCTLVDHFKGRGIHWNDNAYADPRVTVFCEEALGWLENCTDTYDVIFVDLLDPSADTMKFMEKIILASKKLLREKGGLAVNAGCIKKGATSPACDLATFMREEFPAGRGQQRISVKTFVPSYLDEWCFLMIVPKIWSSRIHSVEIVKGVKRFNKEILIQSVTWKDAYPSILRNFWKDFDDSVDEKDKKLVDGQPQHTPRDISEYYGC